MKSISLALVITLAFFLVFIKCMGCDNSDAVTDSWEDVHIICPSQCVCQHSPFRDLSIARWVQGMKRDQTEVAAASNTNEAFFENDISHLENPFIKFVMCMLQGDGNSKDLVMTLPQDVQALVLLHNSNAESNFNVSTTDLLQLPNLHILEIRGTGSNRNLIFHLDSFAPMSNLRHVNFESIKLLGDEKQMKKHTTSRHPSETYDYMPESERFKYNVTVEIEEEVEIVPYNVYQMELAKSKRPTFVGWNELQVLRIHDCQLNKIDWEMFDGLTNLRHMSLQHNDIKVLPPFAFYGARNLKTLSLAHNNILNMHFRDLAGLLELEHLDVSSNNLTKLSEETLPPFPKLKSADLRQNPIRFILPWTFGIMNKSEELILGSDEVALDLSHGSGAFMALEKLKSLSIVNVTALVLSQTMFVGLKSLERLRLTGSINRIEYDAFADMPHLLELILSNCGIFEISMDAFYGIKDLHVIDLSNNQLSFIPPGLFDGQKQLREIYLQRNQLHELPKRFFDNPSVKLIRLIENPWICSCKMMEWNQAITNHVRSARLTMKNSTSCIINPKTGKSEGCNNNLIVDNFPQYSYDFDNKLTPRCDGGPNEHKHRSVYYTLRHSVKCSQSTSPKEKPRKLTLHEMEKERLLNKYTFTMEKLLLKKHNENQHTPVYAKLLRKQHKETKIKKTMHQNAKLLHDQVEYNNIMYNY